MITAERVRELLHYDPEVGVFTWIKSHGTAKAGFQAGCYSDGYRVIKIDGRIYRAHRLAWLYETGEWPVGDLDHKDTNRANNRWTNLRPATDSQNHANSRMQRNNTSGYKGVLWNRQKQRWQARIKLNGRQLHIGFFDAPEVAHAAYVARAKELFGDFARPA